MAVRLKDIAQDLGVSTVTVSKVLRGNSDISQQTRARILARMRELNYQPNMLARGLASGRSFAVGLVVPDLVHPFFGEFARSLGATLRQGGLALVLASSDEDPAIERQEIATLLQRGVDVLLVASCQRAGSPQLFLGDGVKPVLLIDRNLAHTAASFVGGDDVEVGRIATLHLAELGRRRIAHIGGQGSSPAEDRLQGYRRAMIAKDLRERPGYVVTRARFEEQGDAAGYGAMQELLLCSPLPDAVFCYNDMMAIGAMQATMDAGLRIPEDIAFVGCGNLRYAPYLKVPLTSVDHATERMGALAAELTLELATHPNHPPQTTRLAPTLVARQSTLGVPAAAGA